MSPHRLAPMGRTFVAIGMAAFGAQQLAYGVFSRWVAAVPAWLPAPSFWPYATGLAFLAGAVLLFTRYARAAALILSAIILAIAVVLHPFEIARHPEVADAWGRAGKVIALSGAAAMVAASLPGGRGPHFPSLEWLVPVAPYFVAQFFCIGGIEHFIYARFVAQMVPAWIPARLFWAYFAGVALISGGMGIMIPPLSRLAATLTGIMIFSWAILVHIPRALANLHDHAETSGIFEALAISGAAFLIAATARHVRKPPVGC